jgi:uncharacterized protein
MIELDAVEARVIGCLIEKEITTPEYYPMTLNALVNGCNQKSNRDPVVTYEEDDIADALDRLRDKQLLTTLTGGGNRVPKYGHRLQEKLNLGRREVALLCELLLRGPQTIGELKDRAGRMHRFSDTGEVERCLAGMEFVKALPRQPGMKEPRWGQVLSGEPDLATASASAAPLTLERSDRIGELEAEIAELRQRIDGLEQQMARFNQLLS